jgi:hypothetical protein
MKTIAIFQRHGSQWNPDLPVREQAYWDEHARFVDALFAAGTVILEWTIFLDARDKAQG